MYTHIKIDDGPREIIPRPLIRKGDFATLVSSKEVPEGTICKFTGFRIKAGRYFVFEEDRLFNYHESLFVELPPPKTVYVEVEQKVKEELPEPCLT